MKLDKIPDSVWISASKVAESAVYTVMYPRVSKWKMIQRYAAVAIMDERERCQKILHDAGHPDLAKLLGGPA